VGVYGIVNRVSMLIVMMVMGFGQGLQPIVGFNIGAKLYGRVRGVMKFALACATSVMTVGYLLVFLFPGPLASLFTTDANMVAKSIPALRIIMCVFPLVGPQMMTMSFFQSSRRAGIAILLSTSRQLLFLLPLLLFLPRMLGVYGVWWSFPISDVLSFMLAAVFLIRELKRLNKMTPSNPLA
jgi:Na+-driven multidrug efflux pump